MGGGGGGTDILISNSSINPYRQPCRLAAKNGACRSLLCLLATLIAVKSIILDAGKHYIV